MEANETLLGGGRVWLERRSPLLLPFEVPSQGTSPSRFNGTTLRLIRKNRDGKAVRGVLRVGDMDVATLENDDYIIPCGTYPVHVTWSPKFKRMLPIVLNVPGRSGIRVHRGTKPEHSRGCILVSAAMEQELTAKWLALQASNEPIELKIEN